MRISEEKDRRKRETSALERLPQALEDVHAGLVSCVEAYQQAFAVEAATAELQDGKSCVITRQEKNGEWHSNGRVEVSMVPAIPGLSIDYGSGEPLVIEVGLLPGEKLYYRDREKDQYVTMEELTRRILDRAMFPKLGE